MKSTAQTQLEKNVMNALANLTEKDLSLSHIIEYLDFTKKVRYTEEEVVGALISIARAHVTTHVRDTK